VSSGVRVNPRGRQVLSGVENIFIYIYIYNRDIKIGLTRDGVPLLRTRKSADVWVGVDRLETEDPVPT